MYGGAKIISLVPQYARMMGAKSIHISNNDKLGRSIMDRGSSDSKTS